MRCKAIDQEEWQGDYMLSNSRQLVLYNPTSTGVHRAHEQTSKSSDSDSAGQRSDDSLLVTVRHRIYKGMVLGAVVALMLVSFCTYVTGIVLRYLGSGLKWAGERAADLAEEIVKLIDKR